MALDKIKTIIFDFDGTLHNTVLIYTPALKKSVEYLQKNGFVKKLQVDDVFSGSLLGFPPKEAWEKIAPGLDSMMVKNAMKITGESMIGNLNSKMGELYPGTINVLEYLKDKYNLVLLSNAKSIYIEAATKIYGLDRYFSRLIAAEEYNFIPKEEIIKDIMKSYPGEYLVIGDRFHDIEGAVKNNLPSIFCSYGFGEAVEGEKAIYKINSIMELMELL